MVHALLLLLLFTPHRVPSCCALLPDSALWFTFLCFDPTENVLLSCQVGISERDVKSIFILILQSAHSLWFNIFIGLSVHFVSCAVLLTELLLMDGGQYFNGR